MAIIPNHTIIMGPNNFPIEAVPNCCTKNKTLMMAITRRELKRTVSPVDHDNESPVDHNDDSPVDHANPVDHDGIPVNNDKRPRLSYKKIKNGAQYSIDLIVA
jgi:hypothetical protein